MRPQEKFVPSYLRHCHAPRIKMVAFTTDLTAHLLKVPARFQQPPLWRIKSGSPVPSSAQHRKISAPTPVIILSIHKKGARRVKLFAATATAFLALMAGAAARPDIHTVQPDPTPVAADGPLAPARARHSVTVGGAEIPYLASWSELVLANGAGVPQATISATSYVREGVPNPAQRPVLFLFNGGPGASSSPLHFSAFGPRRLMQAEPGRARKLVENHDSLIDPADLVFLDPVGPGFSPELREGGGKAYWSPEGDAQAVLAFIRHWLSENNRAASPVFVAGESYGGYRLALMARHMENLNV